MDIQTKLLIFAIDMIGPLLLGYACKYQQVFNAGFFNKMILNNILVVCPLVSFFSFWILPINSDLLWVPLISIAMGFLPGGIAYIIAQLKYSDDRERGSYVMAASLSNFGTIGGICVFLIYGEKGYAYQQIMVLFQYVFMFTCCYPLAQSYENRFKKESIKQKISLKSMLFSKNQLAVLGILLGGVLHYLEVPRPHEINGTIQILIHFGTWTGLIPVGYSINLKKIRQYWLSLFDLSIIKFIVTPIIIYFLSHIVIHDINMLGTILVLSCMPTAVNAVITSRIYNLNVDLNVAAFIVTTLLFLFIIYPLLFIGLSC